MIRNGFCCEIVIVHGGELPMDLRMDVPIDVPMVILLHKFTFPYRDESEFHCSTWLHLAPPRCR